MPYIITTTTPVDKGPGKGEGALVARRAVATLEEVAEYMTDDIGYSVTTDDLREHFHAGSPTIGPLPDGTVIQVLPSA